MELAQALKGIEQVLHRLPVEEINCIRKHKDEAIPFLLEYVKNTLKDGELVDDETHSAYCMAMYLLAEFRVKEAFPILIKYLELDEDTLDYLIGDISGQDFPSILAGVAVIDDIPKIKAIVENRNIGASHRMVASNALTVLYVEGIYCRDEYFDYLGYLLNEFKNDDLELLSSVVATCAKVCASVHIDLIEEMYKDALIKTYYITLKEFRDAFREYDEKVALLVLKLNRSKRIVTDTLESISWWACFRDPSNSFQEIAEEDDRHAFNHPQAISEKIGRNTPCPCGSGKKYKKCCI